MNHDVVEDCLTIKGVVERIGCKRTKAYRLMRKYDLWTMIEGAGPRVRLRDLFERIEANVVGAAPGVCRPVNRDERYLNIQGVMECIGYSKTRAYKLINANNIKLEIRDFGPRVRLSDLLRVFEGNSGGVTLQCDATCECGHQFEWQGAVTERPPCPSCGLEVPEEQLRAAQEHVDHVLNQGGGSSLGKEPMAQPMWRDASISLPDDDVVVLIVWQAQPGQRETEVWLGYHEGDDWFTTEGSRIAGVRFWGHLPAAPALAGSEVTR